MEKISQTVLSEHQKEYDEYVKWRQNKVLSRLRCVWCENPNLTLKQAAVIENNEDVEESINFIEENIRKGHSNRRIFEEFKFIYGKEILVPNYLLYASLLTVSSLIFLKNFQKIRKFIFRK